MRIFSVIMALLCLVLGVSCLLKFDAILSKKMSSGSFHPEKYHIRRLKAVYVSMAFVLASLFLAGAITLNTGISILFFPVVAVGLIVIYTWCRKR